MAEARFSQDQFRCPVCLDLLKDPVTIPCGHSYCMSCITDCWDQEDQKRVYSCPECRETFRPRPALKKSTMLAEVVEQLKKTELQTVLAGPGDVECDVCTETKHKAVKSCLVCLNSYCQNHLEQHENLFKGKKHSLIDVTGRLQEMICRKHEKLLEIYCHTDHHCICLLCMVDEHKNHSTVSTAAARAEKQKQLDKTQRKFQQQIKEREKKLQELKEAVKIHKRSAQTAVEDSERIFGELICSIERRCSELTQMIRDREKTVVSRAEGLLRRLEQEIDELRRKNAELEQLSHTHDHIHFLQSIPSLPVPPGSPDVPSITDGSYNDVGKSVSQMSKSLEDFCRKEIEKISGKVRCIQIIPTPEFERRKDFLNYFQQFTLDPNTAHNHFCLSDGNRMVTNTDTFQLYPDHPDRFDECYQVLCRESVCGRCYWEVERTGSDGVCISVSYNSISRKGTDNECGFGYNDQSWSLVCYRSSFSLWHDNKQTKLSVVCSSRRMGVYVDHSAGTLSFYSVSEKMNLIHRVQTTFTQPLYPGFRLFVKPFCSKIKKFFFPQRSTERSTVKLCDV